MCEGHTEMSKNSVQRVSEPELSTQPVQHPADGTGEPDILTAARRGVVGDLIGQLDDRFSDALNEAALKAPVRGADRVDVIEDHIQALSRSAGPIALVIAFGAIAYSALYFFAN